MSHGGTVDGGRRRRWRRLAALAAATLLGACTAAGPPSKRRPLLRLGDPRHPNIVFVLTDDLSMNLLPYLPQVQTLRRSGTTMSRYYVVDSLCCPSRAAIFTGQYPHDNGVFTNKAPDGGYGVYNRRGNEPKSFAVALQDVGYRTGFLGKYLNGYDPHNGTPPGWDDWHVAGNGYAEFDYTLNDNNRTRYHGRGPEDYLTDVLRDKGARFIDESVSAGRPFLLEVATFAPHSPYVPAPRYAHTDRDVRYPRTSGYNRIPTDPPSWLRSRHPLGAAAQDRIDQVFRQRVRSVHAIDDLIATLRRELAAKGVADNTYVVFSSDNGYHLGQYRLRPGKQTAFDTDIRVPLLVTGPGVPAGRTMNAVTPSIDLAPTFAEIAGTTLPFPTDGTSMLPIWHGEVPATWPDSVLVEHRGRPLSPGDPDYQPFRAGSPPSYEAIRTADALYVEYVTGDREYYDLRTDPFELHNQVKTAAPAVLRPLRRALRALTDCAGALSCAGAAQVSGPPGA
jgi:N-acetylglucosamine-6-sulfatase